GRDLRAARRRPRLPPRAAASREAAVPLALPAAPRRDRERHDVRAGAEIPALPGAMTVDHPEAIQSGATEKYLLGELGPDERARFEEHSCDCRECAEDVKAAAAFLDGAQELLAEEGAAERVAARPAAVSAWSPRRLFWPLPAGAAVAAALLVAVAGYQS